MAKICKASDEIIITTLKALIYGEPGIGKTTFGLTAPDPICFDFDRGIKRVEPMFRKDYVNIDTWTEVTELIKDPVELKNYKTLIFDTVGKCLDLLSAQIIKDDYKMSNGKTGALTLQGFGVLLSTFRQFLANVQNSGKNIVFIAHDREASDNDRRYFRPDIVGRNLGAIIRDMDLVGYMQSRNNQRTISFDPTDSYYGKNTCKLESIIHIPDMNVKHVFPLTDIFNKYYAMLEKQHDVLIEYKMLLSVIEETIETVTDAATALEVSGKMKGIESIWDSAVIARNLFAEKLKSLNLKYNVKLNIFE